MSATNRGATRIPQDLYTTPRSLIARMFLEIDWEYVHTACDPTAGDGRFLDAMPHRVVRLGYDIRPSAHPVVQHLDYLKSEPPRVDLAITNPPFSIAERLLDDALRDGERRVGDREVDARRF